MKKRNLIYLITSITLLSLSTTATILANTTLKTVMNSAFGFPKNIYAEGQEVAYSPKFNNKNESLENANNTNLKLCEEGFVLLKNDNNALPLYTPNSENHKTSTKPRISIFGKNSVNIAIGGSGSGAAKGESLSIYDSLSQAGYECNPTLKEFYNNKKSGEGRASNPADLDSGNPVYLYTGETPQSAYTNEIKATYNDYNDAAIIVFTRIGGEGFDLPMTMKGASGARKDDDHYLQLDQNETDLLKEVCNQNFKHVIVVLNSGSSMELGFLEDPTYYAYQDKIDAAIWAGYPGNNGILALGKILNGNVNPSGRTADTFATDFKKDPTWNNFSNNRIFGNNSNNIRGGDQYSVDNKNQLYYFVDYEESIYVGYRYYETKAHLSGENWYKENVVYPFGYGLSYTTFNWEITNYSSSFNKDSNIRFEINVTNTGEVEGKDVVEIYASSPYYENGIEKAHKVLVGFEKTKLLKPNETQKIDIEINPYYFASYDYNDKNNNGFKGYELEKGTYDFYISKDAHNYVKKVSLNHDQDERFINDQKTDYEVKNLYTDNDDELLNSNYQLNTLLSRSDFDFTWPTSPNNNEQSVTKEFIDRIKDTSINNPTNFDELDYPNYEVDNGLKLRDLLYKDNEFIGKVDYSDERWDSLLDQMNLNEVLNMYNFAAFSIPAVNSISLPSTLCSDGPVGWTSFMNPEAYKNTASYCNGTIISSTWNLQLVEEFGESVGEEALIGEQFDGSGAHYTGWYAPACNIHRSPFGGRNFEYFSEDSFLSGKIAASEIKGCRNKGVITFLKHFALNEQETHRSISGDLSWVDEQAIREIYLKPFEIAVKEGETLGIMSSFNRIGIKWTGGDYRLLTTILRNEWGFKGAVITDFNTIPTYMNAKQAAYAGNDLNLAAMASSSWNNFDESSIGDVTILRNILKNVSYAVVNSNSLKGDVIGTTLANWQIIIIMVDSGIILFIMFYGAILLIKKKKLENKEN